MATIVILEHELQAYVDLPYMVHGFAERWRSAGHVVQLHRGTANPPPADLAILNIDLTVIPEEYRGLPGRYGKVVNARALDISKRRFSRHLLDRYSDWIGPVIVKTDANFGGKPEALMRAIAAQRALACTIPMGPVLPSYPVYRSLREVPQAVWTTPGLVVERFLPEREGSSYFLRTWFFFGDRERSSRWRANVPVIKASDYVSREEVAVPAAMRQWREALGLEFGKFDYVLSAGQFVLLDVNRTPGYPNYGHGTAGAVLDHLSGGLQSLLG